MDDFVFVDGQFQQVLISLMVINILLFTLRMEVELLVTIMQKVRETIDITETRKNLINLRV